VRGAARALAAAAPVHRAAGFERAAPPGGGCGDSGALGALGALTRAAVGAGGAGEDAAGTWLGDATDMLLDAWVELLADHALGFRRRAPARAPAALRAQAARAWEAPGGGMMGSAG